MATSCSTDDINISALKDPKVQQDLITIFTPLFRELKSEFNETILNLRKEVEEKDTRISNLEDRLHE